ncbi:MAG: hypothetical protein ACHQ7M_03010 [Chloroflexota bacterium]|jgi:hypothetical protein
MSRRNGAKKQTPARRPKKATAKKTPIVRTAPSAKAVELTAENSDYVAKLAAALSEVSSAQERWVQEIEAASRTPALLQDPDCQARLSAAMTAVISAANHLRIEPVPDSMQAANEILGRARAEAELAAAGKGNGAGVLSTDAIVTSIQHLDEMSQLLQEAYRLIRG